MLNKKTAPTVLPSDNSHPLPTPLLIVVGRGTCLSETAICIDFSQKLQGDTHLPCVGKEFRDVALGLEFIYKDFLILMQRQYLFLL